MATQDFARAKLASRKTNLRHPDKRRDFMLISVMD
jgi:hypothetical protein